MIVHVTNVHARVKYRMGKEEKKKKKFPACLYLHLYIEIQKMYWWLIISPLGMSDTFLFQV